MLSLKSPVVEKIPTLPVREVEVKIQDYQVVWTHTGHWPWWPGVVTPVTKRLGKSLLRRVEFFGRDNKGHNTHSDLGKKNIKPFLGKEETGEYQPEVERMQSKCSIDHGEGISRGRRC